MKKTKALSDEWKLIGSVGENGNGDEVFDVSIRRQPIDGDWIDLVVDAKGGKRKKVRYRLAYGVEAGRFAQNRDWKIMVQYDLETTYLLDRAMSGAWRKEILNWWRSK